MDHHSLNAAADAGPSSAALPPPQMTSAPASQNGFPGLYPHHHSAATSTASSDSDDDEEDEEDEANNPDTHPRPGDDRNLRIVIEDTVPTAPALATPTARLAGSHPWPFTDEPPEPGSAGMGAEAMQVVGAAGPGAMGGRRTSAAGSLTEWLKAKAAQGLVRQDGAKKERPVAPANALPHEILVQILRCVSSPSDLRRALLVCKAWCQCGVELLWHKPSFPNISSLIKMLVILASPRQPIFPYASFIRRLNFSTLSDHMNDPILGRLTDCHRLERLTLSSCSNVSDAAVVKMLKNTPDLVALDMSDCKLVTDAVLVTAADVCTKLQGLNLTGCKNLTDTGVGALKSCRGLRRLKLKGCEKVTDVGLTQVAANCPLLLEVDLVGCKLATNATLWTLWKNSAHLRELTLAGLVEVSAAGFPSADDPLMAADGSTDPLTGDPKDVGPPLARSGNDTLYSAPPKMHYDHIRFLDLTSLINLNDNAVAGIVKHMPRIRNLVLAKCSNLTDDSLGSICKLGKYLHYLHLGHVSALSDDAVVQLARACTRLRYIDLACCTNLTDESVFELATHLPRIKRIGLVRVTNITDEAVGALLERTSLERIHLSYCDHISVGAIHRLLQRLHKLTHLSLTGVPAFRRTDLQQWCRAPPKDFNSHQRQAFCVYSGKGVNELRRYLQAVYVSQATPQPDGTLDVDQGVFNEMPDQRTMAAAFAAVRAQSSAQPNGVHSSRRRLGQAQQPQPGLHQPRGFVSLRSFPFHPVAVRRVDPPPGGVEDDAAPGGPGTGRWDPRRPFLTEDLVRRGYGASASSVGTAGGTQPASSAPVAGPSSSRAEAQAGHEFFAAAMGNVPTYTFAPPPSPSSSVGTATVVGPPALQSPIPLHPSSSTTSALLAGGTADDRSGLGLMPGSYVGLGVGPSSAARDRVASSDGTRGAPPRTGTNSLLRRRSTQELVSGVAGSEDGRGPGGSTGPGGDGEGHARGRGRLDVPDRTASASPMDLDLSDDERPDPR